MDIRPKEPTSSETQAKTFDFWPKKAIRGVEQLREKDTIDLVIRHLLLILKWKIFDGEEVVREHSMGLDRVDYALRVENSSRVFIEVKKWSIDLDDERVSRRNARK